MRAVVTSGAPAAIGPYSQGISVGGLVYTAGQTPLDPGTGEMVAGGIPEQTARALENVRAILEAAGSSLQQVVKTTVFLTDMADFAEMNATYAQAFGPHRPARSTVAVKALPKGARVEIEAIATVSGER
jgi:2-iminobutanoate/2-iminopropanoate deaminase